VYRIEACLDSLGSLDLGLHVVGIGKYLDPFLFCFFLHFSFVNILKFYLDTKKTTWVEFYSCFAAVAERGWRRTVRVWGGSSTYYPPVNSSRQWNLATAGFKLIPPLPIERKHEYFLECDVRSSYY